MGPVSKSRATLRIIGDGVDPDEISRLLGCLPTSCQRKGKVLISEHTGTSRIAKTGMWRLRAADREPGDLDRQIDEILSRLTDDLTVWSDLSNRHRIDLFCGLFLSSGNEGVSLDPRSLGALGVRGIELALDIYESD